MTTSISRENCPMIFSVDFLRHIGNSGQHQLIGSQVGYV